MLALYFVIFTSHRHLQLPRHRPRAVPSVRMGLSLERFLEFEAPVR
jgi:hypothetical protein